MAARVGFARWSCGFGPQRFFPAGEKQVIPGLITSKAGTLEGNILDEQEQWKKPGLVVEVAGEVWG